MKKKLSLLFALMLSTLTANAYDAYIDGIYYNLDTSAKTASVTNINGKGGGYSGVVNIPRIVNYNDVTYSVTAISSGAFSYSSKLASVVIPNSVTSIGGNPFSYCTELMSIVLESGNTVYDSRDNCNAIIETASNILIVGYQNTVIPNNVTSIGNGAFSGCSGLKSITIPNSVTSIGNYAFANCSGLTSVTIPNSVTSIGNYAFYNCSGLTSVTIPNSVTSIGDVAFANCSSLTSVTIPNSVTSIGDLAFDYCSGLTSVTIGSGVTSIGSSAFQGCSGLASIIVESGNTVYDSRDNCNAIIETASNTLIKGGPNTVIPNSVTSIGNLAFANCSGLTSVTIPNSVTSIGISAFNGCSGLTSVTIPNSVTSIGNYAFNNCSGLTSVTIGNSVTSIGNYTFYNCSGLTSVTIGSGVTSIGSSAFQGCSGLASIIVESGNTVYDSRDNCNAIIETASNTLILGCKNTIIPNSVTSIGNLAFSGCSGLKSITIPNSVTSIGNYAFQNCSRLTSVTIPNSVTYIGNYSFSNCYRLNDVYCYAEDVPSTGYDIFSNATSIASILSATLHVPEASLEAYKAAKPWSGFGTFMTLSGETSETPVTPEDNSGIYYIYDTSTKEATVTHGETEYTGNVIIPETVMYKGVAYSVTSIGIWAFSGCSGLKSITIPNSVTLIGDAAFYDCSGLTSVTIPNSVTSIGNYAFYNCSGLTSVHITDIAAWCKISFSRYDSNPLYYARHLYMDGKEITDLTIPNSVTSIGNYAFNNCSGLTSVTIPNSVTSIGSSAFAYCSNLSTINLPNSITTIGANAFYSCESLKSIVIPSSVISIGKGAAYTSNPFSYCSSLESIVVEAGNTVYDSREGCNAIITKTVSNPAIATQTVTLIAGCKNTTIPSSVQTIADYAFAGSGLTHIEIPGSVESISSNAFSGCSSLKRVELNSNAIVADISNYSTTSNMRNIFGAQVEEYILGEDVTSIGGYAFYGCSNLKSLTISKNIITIGTNAFYGCTGKLILNCNIPNAYSSSNNSFSGSRFSSLIISDGVESIGDYAFYGFSSLTSVTLSNTLTSIGREAFSGCYGVNSLTIPNSVTEIKYRAFYGCSGLTSISFGNGLTSIDAQIFKGCRGLTSVVIPNSVTEIGEESFEACTGLTSVIIPNSVKKIGSSFCECTGLTSITIPEGVQSIGKDAFNSCSKLATINIANSVADIGYRAFLGTAWYNSQPDGLVYAGKVAYVYKGTMSENTSITLRQGTLGIGGYAFSDRSELTSITIPNSLKTIGSGAFSGCSSLTSVTIPNSVTSIGSSAFGNCTNIKLYLDKNSVALFDLWNNAIKSSTPQMYCRDCLYDINTGKRISLFEKTGSSVRVDKFVPKNYTLTSQSLSINGKNTTMPYHVKGLNPNTSIGEMVLTVEYKDNYGDTQTFTESENVSTEPLNLTTNPAKIISVGNAIVSATTNLDDEETNVGFEWRCIDWPEIIPSNIANSPLYEGEMGGYIRNINADKLWTFRPYYLSDSGTYYYGNWIGFDPTNTSYFEPTVRTSSAYTVLETTANVKGYAMRGTDNIVSQGFKYWSQANSARGIVSQSTAVPSNAKTVEATGNIMTAEFTDLEYETEYHYVAYVTTSENETFYGEECTFTTGKRPSPRGDANDDGEVGMPDVISVVNYILGTPAETFNADAADANQDGEIGLPDVMFIMNYILNGKFPDEK